MPRLPKRPWDSTQTAFDDAKDAHGKAQAALEAAQNDAMAARRRADLLRKSEELDAAQGRLKKAEAANLDAANLMAQAKASPITPETLEELRRLDGNAREAAARLKAVATRLELTPDKGRRALIHGEAIEANALTLIEPTQIKLEGYGAIGVTPGGDDLSRRREAAKAAAAEFKFELDKHGVVDLQDAVRQGGDRESWINAPFLVGTQWVLNKTRNGWISPKSLKKWCPGAESNHRHADFQTACRDRGMPFANKSK